MFGVPGIDVADDHCARTQRQRRRLRLLRGRSIGPREAQADQFR